jgi:hypothetical protein
LACGLKKRGDQNGDFSCDHVVQGANFGVAALFGRDGNGVGGAMSQKARHSVLVLNARETHQRKFHHTASLDTARRKGR